MIQFSIDLLCFFLPWYQISVSNTENGKIWPKFYGCYTSHKSRHEVMQLRAIKGIIWLVWFPKDGEHLFIGWFNLKFPRFFCQTQQFALYSGQRQEEVIWRMLCLRWRRGGESILIQILAYLLFIGMCFLVQIGEGASATVRKGISLSVSSGGK